MKIKFDCEQYRGQNVFALLGAFTRQARKEHWNHIQIKEVIDEAKSGDYDNVFKVIAKVCE